MEGAELQYGGKTTMRWRPMPPWNTQPELSLLAKMKQGDEQAFVASYRRHKDAVYRFALIYSGSPASAADVRRRRSSTS